MNNLDDLFNPEDTFEGSTSTAGFKWFEKEITTEDILKSVEVLDSLDTLTIYVWKGPVGSRVLPPKPFPVLKNSEYVDKDNGAYIVAGFGIVAGKKAYEFLKKSGVMLQWSDNFIPLEEQKMFHLFREWIKIRE